MRNWYVSFGFPHIVYIVVSSYAPGGTRTPNPLSRNQLRYPITPQEQVHQARVELATFRVSDECSNQLSYWCIWEWKDSNLLSRWQRIYSPAQLSNSAALPYSISPSYLQISILV